MDINEANNIILASSSPRRLEILRTHGIEPRVLPSNYEETLPFKMKPEELVMFYSMGKAMDVGQRDGFSKDRNGVLGAAAEKMNADSPIIIGSDTIVCLGDEVFEKPVDKEDGYRMISKMRENTHRVISGVAIYCPGLPLIKCFYETTYVTFGKIPDDELYAYLETDEPYDKSGGYAVQGTFKKYTKKVQGDINNVVGFPLDRFLKEFETL